MYFWIISSGIAPWARARPLRVNSFMTSHVRWMTRADARLADEQVVGLLGQHEAARARASGSKPDSASASSWNLPSRSVNIVKQKNDSQSSVFSLNVLEDARVVRVAGAALEERLGLLAAVAAEVLVEQVDHRPEVAALLDVDLEQAAQVVERRRGLPEQALLLDRGRLGVRLRDDDDGAGAVTVAHRAPGSQAALPYVVAEVDPCAHPRGVRKMPQR